MDLLENRKELKKKLIKIEVGMQQLQATKEKIEKELKELKIFFKHERLRETGSHDTHYWLEISVNTPIGKFSHEQWDSIAVNWPKNLLEYIAENYDLFDEESIRYYVTTENREYINEYKKFAALKEKLNK